MWCLNRYNHKLSMIAIALKYTLKDPLLSMSHFSPEIENRALNWRMQLIHLDRFPALKRTMKEGEDGYEEEDEGQDEDGDEHGDEHEEEDEDVEENVDEDEGEDGDEDRDSDFRCRK